MKKVTIPARMRSRRKSDTAPRRVQHRRYRVAVIISGVMLLILGAYVWWSVASWQRFQDTVDTQMRDFQALIRRQLSAPDLSLATVEDLVTRSQQMQETLCDQSPLIEWQKHLSSRLRSAVEKCHAVQQRLANVHEATSGLYARLKKEQALANIMMTTWQQLKEIDPSDIDKHRAIWMDTAKKSRKQKSISR